MLRTKSIGQQTTISTVTDLAVIVSSVYFLLITIWGGGQVDVFDKFNLSFTYSAVAFLIPISTTCIFIAFGIFQSRNNLPLYMTAPTVFLFLTGSTLFGAILVILYGYILNDLTIATLLVVFIAQKTYRTLYRMPYIFYDIMGVFLSVAITTLIAVVVAKFVSIEASAIFNVLFPIMVVAIDRYYVANYVNQLPTPNYNKINITD